MSNTSDVIKQIEKIEKSLQVVIDELKACSTLNPGNDEIYLNCDAKIRSIHNYLQEIK